MKLGVKAILLTCIMVVLLGVVLAISNYQQTKEAFLLELQRQGLTLAGGMADTGAFAVFTADTAHLEDLAASMLDNDDVVLVVVTDADNQELVRATEDKTLLPDVPENLTAEPVVEDLSAVPNGPSAYRVTVPVIFAADLGGDSGGGDLEDELADLEDDLPAEDLGDGLDVLEGEYDIQPEDLEHLAEATPEEAAQKGDFLLNRNRIGSVHLILSQTRVRSELKEGLRTNVLFTLSAILIAGVLAFYFMRKIVQPMENMTDVAVHMAAGDYSREIVVPESGDEVSVAMEALSRMKESIQVKTDQLYHSNEEVKRINKQLALASSRKSAFLSDMSHEIRTPMNAIIGFAEVMQSKMVGELNDQQEDCVDTILSSSQHLLELINEVLDIAKIEAGKMELRVEKTDFAKLLKEVKTTIQGLAEKKNLQLTMEVAEDVTTVDLDAKRFKQILFNLLSNGIKYTPEGEVVLRAEILKSEDDNDRLLISVRDTGVGIAPEHIESVFSEFERIDDKYSRGQEGTGLGMALTKKLVQLHRGKIWVESEPDRGSTFWVDIPVRQIDEEKLLAEDTGRSKVRTGVADPLARLTSSDFADCRVVYIEDNLQNLKLVGTLFRNSAFGLEWAEDGPSGITLVEKSQPDLVLLDLQLPGDMDGLEVLKRLKTFPKTVGVPVVVLTGHAFAEVEEKAWSNGCDGFMTKPLDTQALADTVLFFLSNKKPA